MFTIAEVQQLLSLRKKIQVGGVIYDKINLVPSQPFQVRYLLSSEQEPDYSFLYEVTPSRKNLLKLSLYLMENETKIGLLRVDYSGQHQNPMSTTATVPARFLPYVGKFFEYHEHHIHYYVEGYRSTLDWALPLTDDPFRIKEIQTSADCIDAFLNFNEAINLVTAFTIQTSY